jgi:hypothetical protein
MSQLMCQDAKVTILPGMMSEEAVSVALEWQGLEGKGYTVKFKEYCWYPEHLGGFEGFEPISSPFRFFLF